MNTFGVVMTLLISGFMLLWVGLEIKQLIKKTKNRKKSKNKKDGKESA